MRPTSSFPLLLFVVIVAIGLGLSQVLFRTGEVASIAFISATIVVAWIVGAAIKIAAPWNRVSSCGSAGSRRCADRACSRSSRYRYDPVLDRHPRDHHVVQGGEDADKDTVPVDVDAVLFWQVTDPQKAALAVADYFDAMTWASQTALRDIIGKTSSPTCWKVATRSRPSSSTSSISARSRGACGSCRSRSATC